MSFRRPSAAKWRHGIALCALLAAAISAPTQAHLPTAQTVANDMRAGWNLGNTLEAQCGETAWGNPAVTPQLLRAVADAGFDLVRVPVTWSLHTGPAPEFTLDPIGTETKGDALGTRLHLDF